MKQFFFFAILLLLSFSGCLESGNTDNETGEPVINNGVKFNTATTYSNETRSVWQKPKMVVDLLGDLEGKTVADIGAGSGYFSFRIVFKAAKVIAIDIDEYMIQLMEAMRQNLPDEYKTRFETRLSLPNDPLLLDDEVDVVIIVNTIAYIEDRVDYLKTLKRGMKPGGRLMIMDFKMKTLPITAPPIEERVQLLNVEKDLEKAGFVNVISDDTSFDYQYIVFAKKDVAKGE